MGLWARHSLFWASVSHSVKWGWEFLEVNLEESKFTFQLFQVKVQNLSSGQFLAGSSLRVTGELLLEKTRD